MKFENRGKWLQEAEDKLAAYDTQEHPDYLDGDDKVLTMEDGDDEELMNFEEDELDVVEEDDTLDSPEEEEDMLAMESSQKNEVWTDIYGILGDIGEKRYFNKQKELSRADMEKEFRKALKIKGLKPAEHDIEVALNKYYEESSQKNEDNENSFIDVVGNELSKLNDRQIFFSLEGLFALDALLRYLSISLDFFVNDKSFNKQSILKKAYSIADKHFPDDKDTMYYILSNLSDKSTSFKQILNTFDSVDSGMSQDKYLLDDSSLQDLTTDILNFNLSPVKADFDKAYNVINNIKDTSNKKDKSRILSMIKASFDKSYKDFQVIKDLVKRSLNESSQKNEAFGGAEMDYSIKNMIKDSKQVLHDITGLVENIDDDDYLEEALNKSRIDKDEFEICFSNLRKYFEKLLTLLLLMDKIDIDAKDLKNWFKPLAQFVRNRKIESSQKNEGPDEFKDNEYEKDFFEYKNGGHGDFMEYLAKACMQADKKNLAKIQKEFPELTRAFCLWKSSGKTDKAEKL